MKKTRGRLSGEWVERTFTTVKGRKEYTCSVCNKTIQKGHYHYTYSSFTDQGTLRLHVQCMEIV